MVSLVCDDGEVFYISLEAAQLSVTLRNMLEDMPPPRNDEDALDAVPIPSISSDTLGKVVQYCEAHKTSTVTLPTDDQLCGVNYDAPNSKPIFDLLKAAKFLNIESLVTLCYKTLVKMIHGKNTDEMRSILKTEKDYTKNEEATMLAEIEWCHPSFLGK